MSPDDRKSHSGQTEIEYEQVLQFVDPQRAHHDVLSDELLQAEISELVLIASLPESLWSNSILTKLG